MRKEGFDGWDFTIQNKKHQEKLENIFSISVHYETLLLRERKGRMAFIGLCKREERFISGGGTSLQVKLGKGISDEWFFFCFLLESRRLACDFPMDSGFGF
jgi:hypothetical protein